MASICRLENPNIFLSDQPRLGPLNLGQDLNCANNYILLYEAAYMLDARAKAKCLGTLHLHFCTPYLGHMVHSLSS